MQAPADRSRCAEAPGMNTCSASSKTSLPRDCEKRCTEGVQPPDIRSASQATVRLAPATLNAHGLDAKAPVDAGDLRPGHDLDPGGARRLRQRPFRLAAQIGDQRDIDARRFQVERGAIGCIMRRRDDDALADLDAILNAIAPRGVGEHHARAIVIREHQRALDRAGRQHHLARAHLP